MQALGDLPPLGEPAVAVAARQSAGHVGVRDARHACSQRARGRPAAPRPRRKISCGRRERADSPSRRSPRVCRAWGCRARSSIPTRWRSSSDPRGCLRFTSSTCPANRLGLDGRALRLRERDVSTPWSLSISARTGSMPRPAMRSLAESQSSRVSAHDPPAQQLVGRRVACGSSVGAPWLTHADELELMSCDLDAEAMTVLRGGGPARVSARARPERQLDPATAAWRPCSRPAHSRRSPACRCKPASSVTTGPPRSEPASPSWRTST